MSFSSPAAGPTPNVGLQKILAFLAPFIAVASGALVSFVLVHLQFLGIFHIHTDSAARDVAGGITFLVTTALVWLAHNTHLLPLTMGRLSTAPHSKVTRAEILAFLMPYISIAAGAIASWLLVHYHFLGVFHLAQGSLAQVIASGLVFAVTAVVTWAAHTFHWLPVVLLYQKK